MTQDIEQFMVAPELRQRPLVDVLVELHGFAWAAERLSWLYLNPWPSCEGKHTCGKNGCGGTPTELFLPEQIETVRGWVATCLAAAGMEQK